MHSLIIEVHVEFFEVLDIFEVILNSGDTCLDLISIANSSIRAISKGFDKDIRGWNQVFRGKNHIFDIGAICSRCLARAGCWVR